MAFFRVFVISLSLVLVVFTSVGLLVDLVTVNLVHICLFNGHHHGMNVSYRDQCFLYRLLFKIL
jgi:hypothetical protein